MKKNVVISRQLPRQVELAASEMFEAVLPDGHDMDFETALQIIKDQKSVGLLFATNIRLDAASISRLPPYLKIAATCSVGVDHIDLDAARSHGLIVTNTPGVLTECTADFAFMLLLNACRRASEYSAIINNGWKRQFGTHEMLGTSLSGKMLGIVGMGRIGQAVARRARAFGMKVAYHDTSRLRPELEENAVFFARLTEMLPSCQALSLHVPATVANIHLLDGSAFALLPTGAVLVNTARGTLVDENALFEALDSGKLAAAGLDVFATEPSIDPRFKNYPQLFLTPHMASATIETRIAMGMSALISIRDNLN